MGRIKPAALLRQSKRQKGSSRRSVAAIAACNLVLVLFLLSIAFVSRQKGKHGASTHHDVWTESNGEAERSSQYAVLNTTKGLITLQLYGQKFPEAVESFLTRSRNGYYDAGLIYMVKKGFMVQTGDQGSNKTEGTVLWDMKGNDESGAALKYEPFTFTMENRGSGSDGSKFFIAAGGTTRLHQNKHSVIGCVIHGQEVLQDIQDYPAELSDGPLNQLVIYSILLKDSL